jgi:hypothetical protein
MATKNSTNPTKEKSERTPVTPSIPKLTADKEPVFWKIDRTVPTTPTRVKQAPTPPKVLFDWIVTVLPHR